MVEITQTSGLAGTTVAAHSEHSYTDWPAIFAGATVASAIAFVLGTFGSAIGLSLTSPFPGRGISSELLMLAVGLWVIWVAGSSFMAGGYIAGRLRRRINDATKHEVNVRDALHGVAVWGVGALLGAFIAFITAAGGTAVSTAIATDEGVQNQMSSELDYSIGQLTRPSGITAAGDNTATNDSIRTVMQRGLAQGSLSDADRNYAAEMTARSAGISNEEARQRVDVAERDLLAAAEKARKAGIIAAFLLAASLLIGAAGACLGASLGGNHRDQGVVLGRWFTRF
jgi:hypothetical protein